MQHFYKRFASKQSFIPFETGFYKTPNIGYRECSTRQHFHQTHKIEVFIHPIVYFLSGLLCKYLLNTRVMYSIPVYYGQIKVWNLNNCKLKQDLIGHTGYLNVVSVSPDGSLCASGGKVSGSVLAHVMNLDLDLKVNRIQ